MTLWTTRRGLVYLFLGIALALPAALAPADEPASKKPSKDDKPVSSATTQPAQHPETQDALQRLMRMKEKMEQERKDAPPESGKDKKKQLPRSARVTKKSEGAVKKTAQPAQSESRPNRRSRRTSIDELKRRARASTQEARKDRETRPSGDFIGPPEVLANNPPLFESDELVGRTLRDRDRERAEAEAAEQEARGAGEQPDQLAHEGGRRGVAPDEPEWFNFVDTPWEDVIEHFRERIGKPLVGDPDEWYVGGTLTYRADRKFTQEEAIDELNLLLHEKGYRFVEQEYHVRLIPVNEMKTWVSLAKTYSSVEEFEKANPRDMDFVIVYYHVPDHKAQLVMDMFMDALPDYSLLSVVEDTNQIRIIAVARDVRKFLTLKDRIDISPSDPRKLKFFKIETNARDIERLVRDFLKLGSSTPQVKMVKDKKTGRMIPKRTRGASRASSTSDVQMVADERTNSIIVKATDNKLEEIGQLIKQFDEKPEIGEFKTTVVEIQHADAVEVASLLNQIFQQEQGATRTPTWQRVQNARRSRTSRGKARQPARRTAQQTGGAPEDIMTEGIFERAKKTIRLVADARMNALIVYANEDGLKRVREMLAVLDQPQPDNFRMLKLENAKVADIGSMVIDIVGGMGMSGLRGGRTAPSIVPDQAKNVFYVIAEKEQFEKISALVKRLDVPAPERERHIIELKNLRPSQVAQMVQALLGERDGGRVSMPRSSGRRGGRRGASMSRLSMGGGANYQVIPLDEAQLLIVECDEEDWEKIENTIQLWDEGAMTNTPHLETFTIEKGNAQTIVATLSNFYRGYQHPAFGRAAISIQAQGDKVMVYSIQPVIDEIASLIETLDAESTEDQVEILSLVNADASTVAQQLQSMFGGSSRGRGRGAVSGPMIQADGVTNSLIVQASQTDLEKIRDFALEQDELVGAQLPEQKFFTLRYAQPRDVANAVQAVFGGGGRGRRGVPLGSQVSALPTGAGQVIVKAPKAKMAEVEAFIAQLDDPQGKEVVIKTIKLEGTDISQVARRLTAAFRQKRNVTAIFDADTASGTILLTCTRDALEEAEALLKEYAEAAQGQEGVVEFRQMVYAQAAPASSWLRDQLITYLQPSMGRRASSLVRVTADTRTNRVVINGPEVAVKLGLSLLEQYDVEAESAPQTPIETVARELAGLDVGALARNLDQIFRNEPRRPDGLRATFRSDELTQTLIISAPKDMMPRINELIETFAAKTKDIEPEQKFIQINEADANYIAGQLRNVLLNQLRRTHGRGVADRVGISVDTRLNRLVINAPKFVMPMAEALVSELDQPPTTESQLRTIALENADAGTVHNVLRTIFQEKIRSKTLQISVEPLTNSLIVGGGKEDFEEIEKWATDLDEKAIAKGGELQIIDILNANPWEIVGILNAQFGGGGWGRRSRIGKEISFHVVAGRSIVAQAPKDKMVDILALIERLDNIGVDKVEVRTYELEGIGQGIHDLANQVTRAVNTQQQARERRITITPYPAADTLIVTARTDQFAQIEEMMDRFKAMVEKETTVTKFIKLQFLDAGRYARQIQDMLANKVSREGRRGSRALQNLQIMPDTRTNRLICYLPEKIVPDLEEIIATLDVEAEDYEGQLRVIELAHADANSVAQTLRPMFEQRRNQQRDRDFSRIIVRIQPETITNSLLVTASDEDFEQIKQRALDIDKKTLVQGNQPQVVDLQYANPGEVANLINQWFGRGRGGRGQNQSQMAQASVTNGVLVVSAPKKQFDEIIGLVDEIDQQDTTGVQVKTYDLKVLNASQVQIAVQGFLRDLGRNTRPGQLKPGVFAEPATNTLVVMAPPEVVPFIDGLIAELEGKKPKEARSRAYVLKHVRAEQIARNVDAMLKAKVAEKEGVKRGTVQTLVSADSAGNRLFIFAPDEYQELAAELIRMVDEEVESGELVHIIPLEDADATELAQALTQIMQVGGGRRGGGSSRVRITADAGSNSILVSGLPKDVAEVEQWIAELEGNSTRVPEMQIFQLKYAMTSEVARLLEQQFPAVRNAQDRVVISQDEYYGRLIVTANKRKMRLVEQYIQVLDRDPTPEGDGLRIGDRIVRFVDINRGSASDIAWDVRDMFPPESSGGPSIEADWFDEFLIVKCRESEFARIVEVIREFERRAKVQRKQRIVKLPGSGADLEQLIAYLRARGMDDDVIYDLPSEKPQRETLIEDLWGEDEEPPQIRQRRARTNTNATPPVPEEPEATPAGGAPQEKRPRRKLSPVNMVLADVEDELFGPLPERVVAGKFVRRSEPATAATFRTAAWTPTADSEFGDDDEPPASASSAKPPVDSAASRLADGGTEPPADLGESNVASPVKKEPTRVIVRPDGTVSIEGASDEVDKLTDAIELFQEDRSVGEVIRIFRFRYGDVSAAAEVLSIMFNQQRRIVIPQQPQRGRGQQGKNGERGQQGMMDQIRGMVGGRQGGRGQQDQGPQMRIATDPGHNYLIIKCDESALPEIRQLLRELDIPPGEVEIKVFQLENLLAEETAENIKDVLGISKAQQRGGRSARPQQRGSRSRRGGQQQQLMEMLQQQMVSVPGVTGGAKVERVEIVSNSTTNSLMVSAPPEVMGLIENVINELEGLEGREVIGIHHFELEQARVDDLLPLLQDIFESTAGGGGGGRGGRGLRGGGGSPGAMGPVTISSDPRTNTIIYTCQSKDAKKVEAQIRQLDIAGAINEAETYVCAFGDAEAIAATVEAIFASGGGGQGGRRGPRGGRPAAAGSDIRVVAEPATNTIIVWGPPDKRDLIFAKIEELDQLSEREIHEIDVMFADPVDLAEKLSAIFGVGGSTGRPSRGGRRSSRGTPAGASGGRVMILGDKAASKLLVRAPDEIFSQIKDLVATLDQLNQQMKLRRFQVNHADANMLVESVTNALSEYAQRASQLGDEVDMDAFTAVADTRTNSIMVVGSEKTFVFVEQILAAVDVETPEDQKKQFRIFMLEKADAATVAEAINGYATGGAGAGSGGRRGGRRGGGGAPGGARELNVYAVPEETTNSVMVFGRLEDIAIVEAEVIQGLEDAISDRYQIETIAVKHVPPSQLVSYVWQFIDQGAAQSQGRSGGNRRRSGGAPGDAVGPQVVPNDDAMTLVVKGTPRQIEEIRDLVARFDSEEFSDTSIKVVEIPYGQDAAALAAEIERIVNESEQSRADMTGRAPRQVTVGADEYTNTLIVAGDPALYGMVVTLVKQLGEVRSDTAVTRVIELRNLSASDAETIINDLQQQRRGRGSSGSRRGSSRSPHRRGGSRRPSGRRGALYPRSVPGLDTPPALRQPMSWVEPYIGVGPFAGVIGILSLSDDQPGSVLERLRDLASELLDEPSDPPADDPQEVDQEDDGDQEPADDPAEPAENAGPEEIEVPPTPTPTPAPATAPSITDTLSGVSGTLRGEVTAKAVDSQRIVITGDQSDVDFIEQILLMMERSTPLAIIEVFTLENAKAAALAPIIEDAIQAKIDARTSSPGPADKFSINAEGRSNSLIVSASEVIMDEIAHLVEMLDVDTGQGTDFRTVVLKHMRAVEAVAQLQPIIEELNKLRDVPNEAQASIRAIERANSVIIVGTPKDVEEIERLVQTVDVELTAEDEEASFVRADVILIQLKNGQATDVAKVLTDMIEEQQENARKSDGEKAGDPFVKLLRLRMADGRELPELNLDRPIKIIPEEGTNSLIIFSSADNNEALQALVGVFDTLPIGAETDVKAFALQYASAEEVAKLLDEVFKDKKYLNRPSEGDGSGLKDGRLPPVPPGVAAKGLPYPLVIQHDARTNTVIVIGRTDAVILAGGLIGELDRPTIDLGLKAYLLELKYMSAATMAEKLDKLLDDRAKALGGDKNVARDNAVIQPEERTNSLIIFATDEVYDMIEDLVLQLDGARKYSVVDVRYRRLKYADAVKLQGFLEEMFKAKEDAEKKTNKDATDTLTVLADVRSNSLMLTGTRDYLREAEELIDELDKQYNGTVVFRVHQVKLNSAANIATLLEEMVDKALKQQDSKLSGTPIHIAADPLSESLLIAASEEDVDLIERWVEILDRPSELGRKTAIIPLRRANAEEISQQVGDLFKSSGGQGEIDLTVTHDPATNSVVAFGPPSIVKDIEGFVRRMDEVDPQSGVIVKFFKLDQASAEDAGDLLSRILELEGGAVGGGGGGGRGAQDVANQIMLIYQQEHPEVGVETLRAMRQNVIVIADIRTNSLIVEAPVDSMPLMESLVAAIDQPPDAAKIRVFRLINSDAEQMVEMLQKLFERDTVGQSGQGGGSSQEATRMLSLGESMGGRQEIAFATDVRTNSVIAAGTPGYLDLVEEMILEIDTVEIQNRETFVYAPGYITAEALAASLRDFSEREQQRLQDIGDEVSTQVKQEREIVAISNEDANRILIDVDPRFKDTVMEVLRGLDRPPLQVMIQVLVIEVTMDNSLDLGVEFAFQDLQWAKAGPTDTTTFDYVGGTDIGAAGSGLGGFTFTITGADFNFLFRTLQNEGSLNVLSRPQIVAMDNQEAMINISDSVPYITGTQTSSTGQISTSVSRQDVGIKLEVTPQINPDGFVRMEIKQEVSDQTGSTVDVGQGLTAPVFFKRETQTTISVKDGETVVLGGLITTRKENREQKVPLLGDIPGVGALFRNQADDVRRTELLVVLTPHVVRDPESYRNLSLAERDRMELITHETLSDPLMQGLRMSGEEMEALEGAEVRPAPIGRETPSDENDSNGEKYGPLRPALRPREPREEPADDSYNVPLTSRARRR